MIGLANLQAQYLELKPEIDQAIAGVIATGDFIKGSQVTQFEDAFAEYIGVEHCIGCGNGTDALEIALSALDLPPGSEVLVQANSFIASAEAIVNSGHAPVFLDCNSADYSVDLSRVSDLISEKTKAIIVVHLYGVPANMEQLMAIARDFDLRVIEDCAQAHGAKWKGQTVGSFGDFSTFSFFPGKNLGAMGDAGAICCRDEALAKRARMIANHGRSTKFGHEIIGRNSRMDTIQAGVLTAKLRYLDQWNVLRRANAKALSQVFEENNAPQRIMSIDDNAECVFHQFVIRLNDRDNATTFFEERGITTGIHYPKSIDEYEPFKMYRSSSLNARLLAKQILSIPVHQYLTSSDISELSVAIKQWLES